MRKIVIAALSTVSVLVLVFSFDASRRGDHVTTAAAASGSAGGPASSQGSDPGAADPGATDPGATDPGATDPPADTSSAAPKGSSGTFTGDEAQTQWGVVQVRIVVRNGRITEAKAVQFPQENHHDIEINRWAIPQLEQATVDNDGQVDSYSGATVTCDGYRRSLQSALDQAHL